MSKETGVLHLNLKKKWFEMIFSGEKKEEYRDITQHWNKRLYTKRKSFTVVCFTNGYKTNAKRFTMEIENIYIGAGRTKWGGKIGVPYYVIKLGSLLQTYNF